MSDQATRIIEMLRAIPREGKISTSELARRLQEAGFPIDQRSVQRDLDRLSQLYPLIADTRNKPYGWKWAPDARAVTLPGLSEAEALTFHLVEKHLEGLLPDTTAADLRPYFRAANERLARSASRSPLGAWTKRIRVVMPRQHMLPPKIDRGVRRSVTLALLRSRQLRISYRAPWEKDAKQHDIHPLGLIQYGPAFYLCVRFYRYPHVRTVALHRIETAEILEAPVEPPKGFDLDRWIAEGAFGFGAVGVPIDVDLEFSDHAGDFLLETPLAENQTAENNGDRLRIWAKVMNTEQLRWWILGFGPRVLVRGPESLRAEIAQQLRDAAAGYASTPSS
jgi:predicted DNA-binding transcriptional regulator YafY